MYLSNVSLITLLASAIGIHAACDNDLTYSVNWNGKAYTCSKLRMPNNEGPRFNLCQQAATAAACPHTCGSCCEDDATYKYTMANNPAKQQDCAFLTKSSTEAINESRQATYCNGYSSGGFTVRAKCQVSCDFCFGTPAPTIAPTSAPTTAPTPAPVADDGTYLV